MQNPEKEYPKLNQSLFWDVKVSEGEEWEEKYFFIIERVLQRGKMVDFKEVVRFYGHIKIKEIVLKSRRIDLSQAKFLADIYNLKFEDLCISNQSYQKLWNY